MKFDRTSRLISRSDFEEVFRASKNVSTGKILRRSNFIVYIRHSEGSPRLGISISKKVTRAASKRNRMKRCLREFFRLNRERFSGDLVVRWLKSPKTTDFEALVYPLSSVLRSENLK